MSSRRPNNLSILAVGSALGHLPIFHPLGLYLPQYMYPELAVVGHTDTIFLQNRDLYNNS